MKNKPRKPRPLMQFGSKKYKLAEVYEDVAPEQFSDETDPIIAFGIELISELPVGDTRDYFPKEQAHDCRRLAKWFNQYADWIEWRGEKPDVFKPKRPTTVR